MNPKVATTFGVNFYGLHLPKGSVYAKLPKTAPGVIWVDDLNMVRKQGHFVVHIMRPHYARPKNLYVDGQDSPWWELARFIRELPADQVKPCVKAILKRDTDTCGPQDRKPQRPILKGAYYNAHKLTQTDATAGVVIGHQKYTSEGYWHDIMQCQTY